MTETNLPDAFDLATAPRRRVRGASFRYDGQGPQALWGAVVMNQIKEGLGIINDNVSKDTRKRLTAEARAWIDPRNRDFVLACEYAGIDTPEILAQQFHSGRLAELMAHDAGSRRS